MRRSSVECNYADNDINKFKNEMEQKEKGWWTQPF